MKVTFNAPPPPEPQQMAAPSRSVAHQVKLKCVMFAQWLV
jgi:hypothetical protein